MRDEHRLDGWVLEAIRDIELTLTGTTNPFHRQGVVAWDVEASVHLEPAQAATLTGRTAVVTRLHGEPELERVQVFAMSGLTLNLLQVDAREVLDEHSADAAALCALFETDGQFNDLTREHIANAEGAYSFVYIDRVTLLPAWRGAGLGRVLTERAIEMLAEPPVSLVALQSHPFEEWDEEHPDPAPEAIARTDHVWESLGFVRITGNLFARDESLIHSFADERARALGLTAS